MTKKKMGAKNEHLPLCVVVSMSKVLDNEYVAT